MPSNEQSTAAEPDAYDAFVAKLVAEKGNGRRRRGSAARAPLEMGERVNNVRPIRPENVKQIPRPDLHADQVLFHYLETGLAMLNALATSNAVPVGLRGHAAEVLVDITSQMLRGPKGITPVKNGMPAVDAATVKRPRPAPIEEEVEEQIPEGWGDEGVIAESPSPILPPPPMDNPKAWKPPQTRKRPTVDGDHAITRRAEQAVLRALRKNQALMRSALRIILAEILPNINLMDPLLDDMVRRGQIGRRIDPANNGVIYHYPTLPPRRPITETQT